QDLRVRDADRVERDIDAPRLVDHGLKMLVHSLLFESVYLRRLGRSACGMDFLGDIFDARPASPREKELRPLARKGTRDGAADPAARSVDHRNLVLQHHLGFLSVPRVVTPDPDTATSRK